MSNNYSVTFHFYVVLCHHLLQYVSKTPLKAACQDDGVLGAFQVFLYTELYLVVMAYDFRINQWWLLKLFNLELELSINVVKLNCTALLVLHEEHALKTCYFFILHVCEPWNDDQELQNWGHTLPSYGLVVKTSLKLAIFSSLSQLFFLCPILLIVQIEKLHLYLQKALCMPADSTSTVLKVESL